MKIIKFVIPVILLLAIAVSASYRSSSAQTQKILGCEGDSQTTARTPLVDSDTYCYKVAQMLGWGHINWAVGGSSSTDVVNRLPAELAATHVDCLLVMIGGNDAYMDNNVPSVNYPPEWTGPQPGARVSIPQFQSNLETINNDAINAGVPWTYITSWSFFGSQDILQERFYFDAAKNTLVPLHVPIVDAWHLQLDRYWNYRNDIASFDAIYQEDFQHPSAAGHTLIANEFSQSRSAMSCAYPGFVETTPEPTLTASPTLAVTPSETPTVTPTMDVSATPTLECQQIASFLDGTHISLCK